MKHNKVLHDHNMILTVVTEEIPRRSDEARVTATLGRFSRVTVRFGFMESPNLPRRAAGFDLDNASFFLSRRALQASSTAGLPLWRDYIFIPMARSASDVSDQFCIPEDRAVEWARGSRSDRSVRRGSGTSIVPSGTGLADAGVAGCSPEGEPRKRATQGAEDRELGRPDGVPVPEIPLPQEVYHPSRAWPHPPGTFPNAIQAYLACTRATIDTPPRTTAQVRSRSPDAATITSSSLKTNLPLGGSQASQEGTIYG